MSDLILVDRPDSGIVAVTMNRPERRNALSIDLLEQLCAEIDSLASVETNRVVILRGAGPVFSAGLDLREAADNALVDRSASAVQQTLKLLRTTPLILIAEVQGGAFAGGAGVMAACDIVVAASDSKIGFPEARRGLLPALICGVLRHRVREGDLRDLFLAGDAIDATRAQLVGLVQRVVPPEQLQEACLNLARSVIAGGPDTIRHTKLLLNETFQNAAGNVVSDLVERHLEARRSPEAVEGLAAFIEKRDPKWL